MNLCACMGPALGDPYCPCVMRQKGIKGNYESTPEDRERLREALMNLFGPGGKYASKAIEASES